MARKSTIDTLPPDILEQLQALLRDPRCTQLDVVARINNVLKEAGHDDRISKSSLNRYAIRMQDQLEKERQQREALDMMERVLGKVPDGRYGPALRSMWQTLAYDWSVAAQGVEITEENIPTTARALRDMMTAFQQMEKSATEARRREQDIQRQAREEAAERAAAVAKSDGVSAETIAKIRRDVLGMAT
jgi:hypothetical protein